MVRLVLIFFGLLSFVCPVFGSEKNKNQVVIFAKVNSGAVHLRYVTQDSINQCKQFNMNAESNSPCFTCCDYRSADSRTNLPALVRCCDYMKGQARDDGSIISEDDVEAMKNKYLNDKNMSAITTTFQDLSEGYRVIPWSCFVNEKDKSHFKLQGDILFSFVKEIEKDNVEFIIKSESNFGDRNPQADIDEFCTKPQCFFNAEQELLEAGVIAKKDGKIIHGPNGFFAKEVKAEQEKIAAEGAERSALFYSRLKKLLCCGSLASAILMYILYQKFYTTAEST